MRVEIDVTDEDIARGEMGDRQSCPVAIAASRAFGIPCHARRETLTDGWQDYRLPVAARAFIAAFDAGEPVAPFAFVLETDGAHEDDED